MPKVKWGGDISPEDIDKAENRGGYAGDVPPAGTYRFKLRSAKQGESGEGNPKLACLLILDGSWKKEHKQYDGCPLWDHMPVTKKTAFRVKAFCDALNISSSDFYNKTVVDDEGVVQKIGKLTIADEDRLVVVSVKQEKNEEYGARLVLGRSGYLPFEEESDDDDSDDDDDDDDDGEGEPF